MLFGLTCDFIQRDGICMVLDEPDGLSMGKLNKVQTRMMLGTMIPNHLRLYVKEIDLRVTLEYAVTGKKMLSNLLKSERLSMNAFFGLLLQIAQGMEEGRLYMLDPEKYALHEDYIFIDGSLQTGKVYLAYIPLDKPVLTAKPGERLRSLIMVLMASITELKGNGVQRLLQYCGEEGFSSGGLKGLLAELLTVGGEPIKVKPVQPDERINLVPAISVKELIAPERAVHEKNHESPKTGWTSGYPSFQSVKDDSRAKQLDKEEAEPDRSKTSGSRIYVALGCLLGDALLWKFLYLSHPNSPALVICGGVSVVLAVLTGMVWSGTLRWGGRSARSAGSEEAEIRAVMSGLHSEVNGHNLGWPSFHTTSSEATPKLNLESNTASRSSSLGRPASFLGEEALDIHQRLPKAAEEIAISIPVPAAPTALLSREKSPAKVLGSGKSLEVPYLERCDEAEKEGPREKIELNRPSFIIGRSTEVAQYIESSEGASRVHAEISKSTAGYLLKDLDSRNGTFFQGEPMIPYKEYPLAEGDVFTIVKGCYTFRAG